MTLWSWKAPLCLSLAFSRLIWSTNEAARLFYLLAARLTLSSLKKRQAARGWTWKLTRKVYQSNGQSDILSAGLFEYRKRANRSGSTNPNLSLCAFPSLLPFQLSNSYIHKLLQLLVFSSYSDTFCREPKDKAAQAIEKPVMRRQFTCIFVFYDKVHVHVLLVTSHWILRFWAFCIARRSLKKRFSQISVAIT